MEARKSLIEIADNECIFWDNACTVVGFLPFQYLIYSFWTPNSITQMAWNEVSVKMDNS